MCPFNWSLHDASACGCLVWHYKTAQSPRLYYNSWSQYVWLFCLVSMVVGGWGVGMGSLCHQKTFHKTGVQLRLVESFPSFIGFTVFETPQQRDTYQTSACFFVCFAFFSRSWVLELYKMSYWLPKIQQGLHDWNEPTWNEWIVFSFHNRQMNGTHISE